MENRRHGFSALVFSCSLLFLLGNGVEGSHVVYRNLQSVAPSEVNITSTELRTGYHFQPPRHWINDPNGPMYYNGIYHLFYQYNPYGAVWGNIVWAHSVSTDLINWIPLDPAIYPSKPFDINGCWSGSATILPGNIPVILYTGINPQNQQVQNVAYPKNLSDPYLREWDKPDYNPIMIPTPENAINSSSFRDPTTAWYSDGHWKVLVGNKKDSEWRGKALLYRSKDFKKWTKAQHPLHSSRGTGMWECPDFFPVSEHGTFGLDTSMAGNGIKHVLKASLDDTKTEYYTIGRYVRGVDRYIPDGTSADNSTGLRYDYGKFYASKTFFDAGKNRRILLAWMNESDSVEDDVAKGWAGVHSIPRSIWLDANGRQLVQWPVQELESLRGEHVFMEKQAVEKGGLIGVDGITAAQADVDVTFSLQSLEKAEPFDPAWVNPQLLCSQKGADVDGSIGPFGLKVLASDNLDEYTSVFFRIYKGKNKPVVLMCSDQSRSTLRDGIDKTTYGGFVDVDLVEGKLSLRTLIDRSIVESFGGGGRTCITARVYPAKAVGANARLYVFNKGSVPVGIAKLNAFSMRKPLMN